MNESSPEPPLTPEQEELLARFAAGDLVGDARARFERELLTNDRLAEAFYADGSVVSALAGAASDTAFQHARARRRPAASGEPGRFARLGSWFGRPRLLWPLGAGAAALVALLLFRPAGLHEPTFRGDRPTLRLLAPVGELSAPPQIFTWTRARGATRYRFQLFDGDAHVVAETITPDTALAVQSGSGDGADGAIVLPSSLRAGFWKVIPQDARGGQLEPPPIARFRVSP